MALTPQQQGNLRTIAEAAIKCEMVTGVPADLLAAQCILESGWLKVCPGNNCFGIKAYLGQYGQQLLLTREWFNDKELAWFLHLGEQRSATLVDPDVLPDKNGRRQYRVYDWFATFPDLAACFMKRASLFLHGAYAMFAVAYSQNKNFEAYVRGMSKVYATAPNYAEVVMSIVKQAEVVEALDQAKEDLERAGQLKA